MVGDEASTDKLPWDLVARPSPRDQRTGRFIRGHSGNPGGRPIGEPAVLDLARSGAALALLTAMKICNDRTAPHHVQLRAADLLLKRGFGRVPAPLPGGLARWPGLRENVVRCLDSFARNEGSDAVSAPAGDPRQAELRAAASSRPLP